jgi:hypothetical protein
MPVASLLVPQHLLIGMKYPPHFSLFHMPPPQLSAACSARVTATQQSFRQSLDYFQKGENDACTELTGRRAKSSHPLVDSSNSLQSPRPSPRPAPHPSPRPTPRTQNLRESSCETTVTGEGVYVSQWTPVTCIRSVGLSARGTQDYRGRQELLTPVRCEQFGQSHGEVRLANVSTPRHKGKVNIGMLL